MLRQLLASASDLEVEDLGHALGDAVVEVLAHDRQHRARRAQVLLGAGVDQRGARDRVGPRHHLGAGSRRSGWGGWATPPGGARARSRSSRRAGRRRAGSAVKRGRAIEVGRLAGADDPDLVAVGGLGGVGGLLRPLAARPRSRPVPLRKFIGMVENSWVAPPCRNSTSWLSGMSSSLRHRAIASSSTRVELLAAVAALGDAEALALVVDQGLGRGLQHLQRQHGGTGGEVENALCGHEVSL